MQRGAEHVSLTVRVPVDVKRDVERVAREIGISQSAVWKILISRHVRPALDQPLLGPVRLETPARRAPPADDAGAQHARAGR